MGVSVKIIFPACFKGWCYFYGFWLLFLEIIFSSFPITLIGSIVILLLVYIIRLPPPPKSIIDEVIGEDLNIEIDEDETADLEVPFRMTSIGQRACGFDAPENSLSALRMMRERGGNAVEIDVALTLDNIPVLFHDKSLERMCNIDRKISTMTYEELENFDISVAHPFGYKYEREQIPRLDDALEEAMSLGFRIIIDLKENDLRLVETMVNIFKKYPELQRRAIISSFYPHIIFLVRRAIPDVVCAMAWRPGVIAYEDYTYSRSAGGPYRRRYSVFYKHWIACLIDPILQWSLHNLLYFLLGISVVILHKDTLSPSCVRHWRKRGIRVIAWPINLPGEKEYFSKILQVPYMTDTLDAEPLRLK